MHSLQGNQYKMQSLFKLRSVPIMRVRCVMGKPYMEL